MINKNQSEFALDASFIPEFERTNALVQQKFI
jgi:hypothetical protein